MNKRFIISESEKNEIRKMYGLINEENDVISQYVSDPRLQKILRDLQTQLGETFTKEHFDYEIGVSGNVKKEAGALLPEVINAFNKMKKESGCPNILINEKVSYRTYEMQRDQFLKYATQSPKINTALKQAAIPGFSAHHSGTAIDYYEDGAANLDCLTKGAWPNGDYNKPNKWGFTLPYMSGNIRKKEPWHLQYVGVGTSNQNKSGNQTNNNNQQKTTPIKKEQPISDNKGAEQQSDNKKSGDSDFDDAFGTGGPNVTIKKEQPDKTEEPAKQTTTDYQLDTPEKIQEFQTWMDGKYNEWAYSKKYKKNYKVGGNPNKGFGKMGPNTTREWANKKDEYLKEKGLK